MKGRTRSSDTITRNRGFYFDALRMSFGIARQTHGRLWATLAEIEPQYVATGSYDDLIASVFSDAWSLVDVLHRVREVAVQATIIPKKNPATQIFVRKAEPAE